MITVSDLALSFQRQALFSGVNLIFQPGNCYGVIGANGAGKSTFLRILSGELEPTKGQVVIDEKSRMSVLKQDHYAYEQYTVFETILQGNPRLYQVLKEKDALYEKPDFSEEDGNRAAELEAEFAELNGWEAETEAGKLLQGLGLDNMLLYSLMSALKESEKVKVLLARALFGQPDIILLDEPTNGLDPKSITWLENFLLDYEGTVIVVSHDRYFLNNVCTHIVDIDYTKIKLYVGNYDFWYDSSQLMQRLLRDQNRKVEEKKKDLEEFIRRFSANKSKSRQATSRKKLLDKLTIEEMPASSRRYPFVSFTMDREPGKEILTVEGLSKTVEGGKSAGQRILPGEQGGQDRLCGGQRAGHHHPVQDPHGGADPRRGQLQVGGLHQPELLPPGQLPLFGDTEDTILQWLEQYSKDTTETYLRGFLGKMLFSGDDVYKPVKVLSGGEKVRCMLSRMMMFESNVLLLDQPTNHLDLESITAVNNGLIDFKGVVLFTSHDHEFTQTVANRIIELLPEGGVFDRMTTYDEYLEMRG